MLPNIFVVGAQKAGTTAFHNYLSEHPDIYLPEQKETKFFVDANEYAKGIDYYESKYFSDWSGEDVVGEVDPDYMYFVEALSRIKENIGNPKFIFLFRNPVDRAFSHYLMTYHRGLETLSFEEAIDKENERLSAGYYGRFHYSYISRGFYYRQVQRFLKHWDISRMHFLLAEDLLNKPAEMVRECFGFMGVSQEFTPSIINSRFHESRIPKALFIYSLIRRQSLLFSTIRAVGRCFLPHLEWREKVRKKMLTWNQQPNNGRMQLKKDTRTLLQNIYRDENYMLSELIGRNLEHWG